MPKKLYYKIGEACKVLDIQPYVLRYWETEFPFLSPKKNRGGQRVYEESDLEVIRRINELLYDEGYTIAGAKKKLEAELAAGGPGKSKPAGKASSAADGASSSDEPPLDSPAGERVEQLVSGLREALGQSREILDRLR